jgi:hypothetical protein
MKNCNLFVLALSAPLTLAASAAISADGKAHVPHTAAAASAADLISRVERAVNGYVAACVSRDAQGLDSVTTSDVRIEYALSDPGAYFSLDASSLISACTASIGSDSGSRPVNLWIYPTHDADAVFVQYDAPSGSAESNSRRQIALVEMRGDRIYRMVNFAAAPPYIVANAVRKTATTLADLGSMTVTAPRIGDNQTEVAASSDHRRATQSKVLATVARRDVAAR